MLRVANTQTAICDGVGAHLIDVQVHISTGLPRVTVIGLADAVVADSRERIRSAFATNALKWPDQRITIALSPADQPKRGAELDLAIGVAILVAAGDLQPSAASDATYVGELNLDGSLRGGSRTFAIAGLIARMRPGGRVFVPAADIERWALVPGIRPVPITGIAELVAILRGEQAPTPIGPQCLPLDTQTYDDLSDVTGQSAACQALEVAAAGGHHLLLSGAPGIGKTMLCQRFAGLVPDMSMTETLEVAAIREVTSGTESALSRRPPFQAPHHTSSHVAMVGGGQQARLRPGMVTQAHHGVLFLDEAPEFRRESIEALRQPLESGQVTIARAGISATLPAQFQLLMTQNPCPCGQAETPGGDCRCGPTTRQRYENRLSGPLLDRVDLRVRMRSPVGVVAADATAVVRERICAARERGQGRLAAHGYTRNQQVHARVLRKDWPLASQVQDFVNDELGRTGASARSRDKILRVAWTIADLADRDEPSLEHVAQAVTMRDQQ